MKTVIVLSDTHARCFKRLERLMPLFEENDFVVHLGDGSADMRFFSSLYPQKTYLCRGNCDFSLGEEEFVLEEEGVRLFCCHGHRYGVKSGLSRLAERALELNCGAALYGHTHEAEIRECSGVLCFNPGALSSPWDPSYGYLVLHRGKIIPTVTKVP